MSEKQNLDEHFYSANMRFAKYILICLLVAILTLLLIVLKLANIINISWWYATAPTWGFILLSSIALLGLVLWTYIKNHITRSKYITKDLYNE